MLAMTNDCFFCGATESLLTEEHVWPQWISRLLAGRYDSTHFVNVRSTHETTTALRNAPQINVTTDGVCAPCNNEWLSDFENREIKPIATPLIAGSEKQVLRPEDQWRLAAWIYKMAMVLELAIPSNERRPLFFTPEERREFRRTTIADDRLRIWIAHYRHGWHPAHAQMELHRLTGRETDRQSFDLKVCTMTAGSLAMQLIAVRSVSSGELVPAKELEIELHGKGRDALVEIWPPTSAEIDWPPAAVLTQQDIEDWTTMWASPGTGR